ncbi:tryptophan dimethylallyltransferase-domain-containing protein [Nemania sp. FL0031]|nr:tryptophan dimethylallyltransferase-domain-containing protein [Nemania sp. FL0031]
MLSLLSDLGSGESPVVSLLSMLPVYSIPFLFSLFILTVCNALHKGWLPSVMKRVRTLRSETELHVPHLQLAPVSPTVPVEKESQIQTQWITHSPYDSVELSVWHRVNSELEPFKSHHQRFWWSKHSGKSLAILLHAAEYPEQLQYRDLKFFATDIAPYLGISHETTQGDTPRWPSFMTDDGTPLELSWDWGTKDGPPTIRYSIEPIGLHAGFLLDPSNLLAGPAFQKQLLNSSIEMRLEWFQHFKEFFDVPDREDGFQRDIEDHNTSIFYAFDLSPTEVTAKAYFFPKTRARARGQSNLEVLTQAMQAAPHSTKNNLDAWQMFCDFSTEISLEYEMLAIDLIDPLESRLKIYFRCRETTFNSVVNIMTVGGRIKNPKLYQGLEDLKRLWDALFHAGSHTSPDQSLREVSHRTAGILYNIEFRLGEAYPVAKIYLPVRHYSNSDEAIIRALSAHFQQHQRGKYMPNYVHAMQALFSPKAMQERSGIHTYIGCAIRPNGTLRVVSYFKPGVPDFIARSQ